VWAYDSSVDICTMRDQDRDGCCTILKVARPICSHMQQCARCLDGATTLIVAANSRGGQARILAQKTLQCFQIATTDCLNRCGRERVVRTDV
jgi:hypothetical protein